MFNLIETGRQHRFRATAVHMLVFLFFYLLHVVAEAVTGIIDPLYPLGWAVDRRFLYLWAPVLILRLLNCNIVAGCITGGFFSSLVISIPLTDITVAYWNAHRGPEDYESPLYGWLFWMGFTLLSIIAGIVLECLYRDWKWKHPSAVEGDAST
ncbi:MAG: hypothetical protein LIO78_08620 [Clostridiales bacterium]|nr:hypothetical protein [Clostridiales bacterium]